MAGKQSEDRCLWDKCADWLRNDVAYSPRGTFCCANVPTSEELEALCRGRRGCQIISWLMQNVKSQQAVREIKLNIALQGCTDSGAQDLRLDATGNSSYSCEEVDILFQAIEVAEREIDDLLQEIATKEGLQENRNSSLLLARCGLESLVTLKDSEDDFRQFVLENGSKVIKSYLHQFDSNSELTPEKRKTVETALTLLEKCVDSPESALHIVEQKRAIEKIFTTDKKTTCVSATNILHVVNNNALEKISELEYELSDVQFTIDQAGDSRECWEVLEADIGRQAIEAISASLECQAIARSIITELSSLQVNEHTCCNIALHGSTAAKERANLALKRLHQTLQSQKQARAAADEAEYKYAHVEQHLLATCRKAENLIQENLKLQSLLADLVQTAAGTWTNHVIESATNTYKTLQKHQDRTSIAHMSFNSSEFKQNNLSSFSYRSVENREGQNKERAELAESWAHMTNQQGLDRLEVSRNIEEPESTDLLELCKLKKMETIRLVNTCKYTNETTIRATLDKIRKMEDLVETWWTEPGQGVLRWITIDGKRVAEWLP